MTSDMSATEKQMLWAEAVEIADDCPGIKKQAYLRIMEILVHHPEIDQIEKYLYEFDKDPRGPSRNEAYWYFVRAKLKQMTQEEWYRHPYAHFEHFNQLIANVIKRRPYSYEAILDLAQACKKFGPSDLAEWAYAIEAIFKIFMSMEWQTPEPLLKTHFGTDCPTYESESLSRFYTLTNELLS